MAAMLVEQTKEVLEKSFVYVNQQFISFCQNYNVLVISALWTVQTSREERDRKPGILNTLIRERAFIAVEKRMVWCTRIGSFISPQKAKLTELKTGKGFP